jgi:hypothetical protein
MPVSAATPTVINGVAMLTRSGKPKSRFSEAERLQLLGATKQDLRDFIALFCPDRPLYAATRRNSCDPRAWTTPPGRLKPAEVLRHLTADLTPGLNPMWVAPRCWEVTRWVGLDVDYRGDREDFVRRCRQVLEALSLLGVHRRAILRSPTPSGGRHYRFFLTRKVRVRDVPQILGLVGLVEAPGQIEIFPKQTNGMRLPFGLIPGREHRPRRWVRFVRAYRHRKIPRVSWFKIRRLAEKHAPAVLERQLARLPAASERTAAATPCAATKCRQSKPSTALGVPKRLLVDESPMSTDVARYLELLENPISEPSEAAELWDLGIRRVGTRVKATKRIVWHLLFARGLSVEDATNAAVRWVYETGSTTSADVMNDLGKRTWKVEKETRNLVRWMAARHVRKGPAESDKSRISKAEVDAICKRLGVLANDPTLVTVALKFLRFAKLHGTPTGDGWSVQVAVNGVIRRWPGCRGMGYKPLLAALTERGIVRMTREKRQSANGTGRPRTYLVCISPEFRTAATMTVEEAVKFAGKELNENTPAENTTPRIEVCGDTYRRFIPPTPQGLATSDVTEVNQGVSQNYLGIPKRFRKAMPFGLGTRVHGGSRPDHGVECQRADGPRGSLGGAGECGMVPAAPPPATDVTAVRLAEERRRLCRCLCRRRHRWLRRAHEPPLHMGAEHPEEEKP